MTAYDPLHFILNNWALLMIVIGIFLISRLIVHMDSNMVRTMRLCGVLLVVIAAADFAEAWTATFPEPSVSRILLSALGYTLRPALLIVVTEILAGKQKPVVLIPAVLNGIICFSALFWDGPFGFTELNEFYRGPWGVAPFIAGGFYLLLLLWETARYFPHESKENLVILGFIAVSAVLTLVVAIVFDVQSAFNVTYAADILLYYLFLHVQLTKRDPMTKLLNRQSYYHDLAAFDGAITGVMSIDMNELKQINDSRGHQAGDEAICAVSDCFARSISARERAYRVGGDEFIILSRREGAEALHALEQKIREALKETGYHCSFGCAVRQENETLDALCKRADLEMYEDKAAYYSTVGQDRRRR